MGVRLSGQLAAGRLLDRLAQRVRSQPAGSFGHLVGPLGKQRPVRSRDVEELQPLRLQADLCQQVFCVGHGADRREVALQEMAVADVAASYVDGVGPVLEGL